MTSAFDRRAQWTGVTVLALYTGVALFTFSSAARFDVRRGEFLLAYWVLPVLMDAVLLTMIVKRHWRPNVERSNKGQLLVLIAPLVLTGLLAPVVVAAAVSGALASAGIVADEQPRFVGTALVALIPMLGLTLLSMLLAGLTLLRWMMRRSNS